jgi:hypothetical protein
MRDSISCSACPALLEPETSVRSLDVREQSVWMLAPYVSQLQALTSLQLHGQGISANRLARLFAMLHSSTLAHTVQALTLCTLVGGGSDVTQKVDLFSGIARFAALQELTMPDWHLLVGADFHAAAPLFQMQHLCCIKVVNVPECDARLTGLVFEALPGHACSCRRFWQ